MDSNSTKSEEDREVGNIVVSINRKLCIGAGSCVAVAPQAFTLDHEAKAIFLPGASDEGEQTILDAARACPVSAIMVKNLSGKKIFP